MIEVGTKVKIPAGTRVTQNGATSKRTHDSVVTVKQCHATRAGNAKITWKSHGYPATAVLKG